MEQTFSKIHFIKTAFHKKMEHDILIDSLILYTKKEIEANLIIKASFMYTQFPSWFSS